MNKRFITPLFVILLILTGNLSAQKFVANYVESKVPAYTLPDPLVFADGKRVSSRKDWMARREELLKIFGNEVYGVNPEWKGEVIPEVLYSDENALNGVAVRREIKLTFRNNGKELPVYMLLYLPKSEKKVPVFLGYNFNGNHAVTTEPGITLATLWKRADAAPEKAGESDRGSESSRWPVSEIISRGYGVATMYYCDVDPDFDDGFKNGIHALFDQPRDNFSWGSIATWAWGLSRAMDYLETVPEIDPKKVTVIGHSRLGKTALWAGATDQRFAIVVSNCSGAGGAALSKRVYGETVGSINRAFPHWFCRNFSKYNEKEELLPVDQHELLALIAPRPLYVASAEEDQWADPKGEFLSCAGASPVYQLLVKKSFAATQMPKVNSPVTGIIGYHMRTGKHDINLYDWKKYLDFADKHFGKKQAAHGE